MSRFVEAKGKFNERTKFFMDHSQKNVINLETSSNEDEINKNIINKELQLKEIDHYITLK